MADVEKFARIVHVSNRQYKLTVPVGTAKKMQLEDGDTLIIEIRKME